MLSSLDLSQYVRKNILPDRAHDGSIDKAPMHDRLFISSLLIIATYDHHMILILEA